jgi:hypothetical protein
MDWDLVLTVCELATFPFLMAAIGGYLAAKVLEQTWEKKLFITVFAVLFVGGMVVSIVRETRVARQDKKKDERLDVMQGLLQTAVSVISHPPANLEHQDMVSKLNAIGDKLKVPPKVIVQQLPPPKSPLTTEERFKAMQNSELRDYTLQWINKLRDFEKNYEVTDYNQSAQFRWPVDPALRDQAMQVQLAKTIQLSMDHENEFQKYYWGDMHSLYAEIKNRLDAAGVKVPSPSEALPGPFLPGGGAFILQTISDGRLSGPSPLGGVANYLEVLARALPIR